MNVLEDASGFTGSADELFTPDTQQQVCSLLKEASENAIQVTLCGSRTGLTGGCIPDGGWEISLEKLQSLYIDHGRARAGAGVTLETLQAAAGHAGQIYAPDPTEWTASIGGTIATNASGSRSLKYGATRRWVERLRVVLAGGQLMDVARGQPIDFDPGVIPLPEVTKNTAGYLLSAGMDWVDLFVGSEGTLAVVTQAHLRLLPNPPAVVAGVIFFPGDESAVDEELIADRCAQARRGLDIREVHGMAPCAAARSVRRSSERART